MHVYDRKFKLKVQRQLALQRNGVVVPSSIRERQQTHKSTRRNLQHTTNSYKSLWQYDSTIRGTWDR
jgi:hypothetical protein